MKASGNCPLVCVIVLCYNERKWLQKCLSSLLETEYPRLLPVLVDNASKDDSVAFVRANFPKVTILQNQDNLGFAEGNNVGIRHALKEGADYVVLLNPDTHVRPDWIATLVDLAEAHTDLGIITPMLLDYEGAAIDRSCLYMVRHCPPLVQDLWRGQLKDYYEIDDGSGAAFFVRRRVYEEVGLIDPFFFIYFEDIDMCRRARYHGWKRALATGTRVYHYNRLENTSIGTATSWRSVRGRFIFLLKNPFEPIVINVLRFCLEVLNRSARAFAGGRFRDSAKTVWLALGIFLAGPRVLWRRRKEMLSSKGLGI